MRALYSLEWRDRNGGWMLFNVFTSIREAKAVARPWHQAASPADKFQTRIRKWVRSCRQHGDIPQRSNQSEVSAASGRGR